MTSPHPPIGVIPMVSTAERLQTFVQFVQAHLTGDEKGEAQIFLDRFFQAFGHGGAIEVGAVYEKRIEKGSKKGKTGFADLVWKPRVLIEMKKRGADLSKHYSQAFDYWQRAIPNRPRYVMLCNFDEFWIYDFDIQIDTPIDQVKLIELPDRVATFGFMEVIEQKPVFGNNQVEVTEKAARRLGELYQMLRERLPRERQVKYSFTRQRYINTHEAAEIAQRFILQCVLAMFAEDRGLLPNALFISCVQDCLEGASSYDVLGWLFSQMNYPDITPSGRFKGVDYFNGGLFSQINPIELTQNELMILRNTAEQNWSMVRPGIFGSIFESAIDEDDRHSHGIHYTAEADIMKIVRPTISHYWEERIEGANTLEDLEQLQVDLKNYRILDPACGSGNFLYIAYQELKNIEKDLLDKLEEYKSLDPEQVEVGLVTPMQFFGMDNNAFAVELARITLMIARKVAIDRLGLHEPALPLDTLDQNIICKDALFTPWPPADAVIGNPPFLGGKHLRLNLGDKYIDRVFARFPEVKDSVDFCAYWFRLAHDHLGATGRAGLVGTNSISQGKSRLASLDYVVKNGGFIYNAVSSQPWPGEAKVHVSIVNWSTQRPSRYVLDDREVPHISSSLKDTLDVTDAVRLDANANLCFQGVIPVGTGFLVNETQVQLWTQLDPKNQQVLKLFSMGANLAQEVNGLPDRWIIDFANMSLEEASSYKLPFEHVKKYVKPARGKNRREVRRINWWKHGENASAMRNTLSSLETYFAVPEVSKWAIFIPCPSIWLSGNKTKVIASEDFYILGVLTSGVHRAWMHAQKSTLEDRIAYTHITCFETFPFPQSPSPKLVKNIRQKALELHQYRSQQMEQKQWGITKLYNAYFEEPASQLAKLHQQLDRLVLQAYGFSPTEDLLRQLLTLNLQLATQEQNGQTVIGPWDPTQPHHSRYDSPDRPQ